MLRPPPLLALPLLTLTLLTLTLLRPAHGLTKTNVPLSYEIPFGSEECIYERIAEVNEHLTASVFIVSGEEMASAIVFEGPVAPLDLDAKRSGRDLKRYVDRYEKEGVRMFVDGKYGDAMLNVKPVRIAEMVNFEEEEEDYLDDDVMTDEEREDFNEHHDQEHQHPERPLLPPRKDHRHVVLKDKHRRRMPGHSTTGEGDDHHDDDDDHHDDDDDDDDFVRRKEMNSELLKRMVDLEAEVDDDFVKLQMDSEKKKLIEHEMKKGDVAPERRKLVTNTPNRKKAEQRAGKEQNKEEEPRSPRRRRLREELRLVPGEPYQKTIPVESPGWYRLCVHGKSHTIAVEMELRKSSLYGKVNPHTGHVPYLEEVETHSDIHSLFTKEDDEALLAEEGIALNEEDLETTKEQLRILERVYSEIIQKQLAERRTWNWRTSKNQHLYSHLVLGNLVETIVYMGITGWQVYTVRKWFGGSLALGR